MMNPSVRVDEFTLAGMFCDINTLRGFIFPIE